MDENQNQQNFGGMSNNQGMPDQGQGRPSMPPPPPPPEITLRTMQSDIESVRQSGGENPMPKPFTPPELKKQPVMELDDLSKEEGMIKPASGDGVIPPSEPKKSKAKAIILILVSLLLVGAVVYIGYAYVYPNFIAKPSISLTTPPPDNAIVTPAPVVETTPVPEPLPVATTTSELATTTPEIATTTGIIATTTVETATTTATIPPPAPVKLPHVSLLVSQPEMSAQIAITASSTLSSIKDSLIAEAGNKPQTVTAVKEIVFTSELGQPAFADVLSMILPEFTAAELSPLFKGDFTTVMTYDKDGTWLGFVAQLSDGVSSTTAKIAMAKLEKSASLANLYLQAPGIQSTAGFKAGTANNLATRYISFAKTGASLNYGWTNNNLFVMSGSYNGMKALLTKLGIQ